MRRPIIAISLLCCTVPIFPATAQNSTDTAQSVLSDFLSCDPLIIPAERLGCYDSLLKKYKIRYGLIEATPEAIAEAERDRPRQITSPRAVPQGRVGEENLGADDQGKTTRGSFVTKLATAEDLTLPLETKIMDFAQNRAGDFKIRISEGFVFESAGGRIPDDINAKGQTILLTKNFLGQWRMKLSSYEKLIEIRPISD
ncbi:MULTISPECIES: hypothetical protein [unclassified Iodidimonas]|jgi:hypothetical protein|uniref:hypothetical protein n=1 Tax=unclassified Iodidimonas TaxID=2626145 RepID=UPI0024826A80|nr:MULTISPECIES: hypothetical protein [unclassified Iodidimonas]